MKTGDLGMMQKQWNKRREKKGGSLISKNVEAITWKVSCGTFMEECVEGGGGGEMGIITE